MIQQSHSWAYIRKKCNSKRYMDPSVHRSTIYKTWKKPKCPLTDEWIKMWYTYSAIKKNEIMPFAATWMDLEIIILSEVSQKERQIPYDIAHMWNLKSDTNELLYETEADSQT